MVLFRAVGTSFVRKIEHVVSAHFQKTAWSCVAASFLDKVVCDSRSTSITLTEPVFDVGRYLPLGACSLRRCCCIACLELCYTALEERLSFLSLSRLIGVMVEVMIVK